MMTSKKTDHKSAARVRRHVRVRKQLRGDAERPRLAVFRSNKHLYAQIIDDDQGITLVAASTKEKDFSGKDESSNCKGAKQIGKMLAERALSKSIKLVRFDRAGFQFHGRVKAFADAAREAGLQF